MSARKKGAVLMAAAAVIVAAVYIVWVLDVSDVGIEPTPPTVESGYYDQFLFSEDADVTALLVEATLDRYRVSPADGKPALGTTVYDGAVLAPWLPNCAEMVEVRQDGRIVEILYVPRGPEDCVQVELSCQGGRVTGVHVTREDGGGYIANVEGRTPAGEADRAALLEMVLGDTGGWADRGALEELDRKALLSAGPPAGDPGCRNPLSSGLAFVLSDGAGLTPEEAAVRLLEELLEYYSQRRPECPFVLTGWSVGEQTLTDRAGLEALAAEIAAQEPESRLYSELLRLREEYPLLGEDMWLLTPEVRASWTGNLDREDDPMYVWGELTELTPASTNRPGCLWVLIHDDGQWWLQRSAALTALLTEE